MNEREKPVDEPFTVLIPERGRPDLLGRTLRALATSRAEIDTANHVHILVNGTPPAHYQLLVRENPDVEWFFHPRPLGFHGAISHLLETTDAPWVYLLNSDMQLATRALAELLPWRANDVFAIASQIEFSDRARRREETGWTGPVRSSDGQLELHDLLPPDETVRGTLYAGGGASMFQTAMLRRYLRRSRAYAPFYFEDADWAVQAWSEGANVLFCPSSRAVHVHRGTIGRFVRPRKVQRIVRRNLQHFRWRYGDLLNARRWDGCAASRLGAVWRMLGREHRLARRTVTQSPVRDCLEYVVHKRYPHAQKRRRSKPRVLLVSPFAVLPPAHGGARRIVELARATSDRIDWILLHDEAAGCPQRASSEDGIFREIHPVGGRPDSGSDLAARWQDHAHSRMRAELARLIAAARPDAICFEHLECIGLIESVDTHIPLIWTLHDAGRELPVVAADRVREILKRVDTLLLCTEADIDFWPHPRQRLIENGVRLTNLTDTAERRQMLIMVAPLRYEPNRTGLKSFLTEAWPLLRRFQTDLQLRILAGDAESCNADFFPYPEGVEFITEYVDPAPHYRESLLALNVQGAIEGSALKIPEALAHGRVMISTRSGARGYEKLESPALKFVPTVADMVPAIQSILADQDGRAMAESRAQSDVKSWSWESRGGQLVRLIEDCLQA